MHKVGISHLGVCALADGKSISGIAIVIVRIKAIKIVIVLFIFFHSLSPIFMDTRG
jgi:hypothetical protein